MTSELIRSSTSRALTGSSSLTRTRTVGCEGVSEPSDSSSSTRFGGRISAASASPDSTMSRACSSLETGMHSIREQSSLRAPAMSNFVPASTNGCSWGTWLRKATRGVSGPRESAKPISTAITTG